jgi:tripartite-type tricarboxylate transporter receptor subunit TctC
MYDRIKTLIGVCFISIFGLAANHALAQKYPSHPIKLIVPFAPGGAVDQVSRIIATPMADSLGQPIVIENRPGASGSVGAAIAARAKPDGHTLLMVLDSQAVNHLMVKDLGFDTFKSFSYLSLLVTLPQVLVATKQFGPNTIPELVAYVKSNPNASYGSAGIGSAGHVNSATLAIAYGINPTHIPYKGAGPMVTDLLGGHIDFAFGGLSVMLSQIQSGRLKALAVSSSQRHPQLPTVPTVAEYIPGFEIPTWIGIVGPAGLPLEIKERLLATLNHVLGLPEVRKQLADQTFQIVASSPESFLARVKKDSDAMSILIQKKIVSPE